MEAARTARRRALQCPRTATSSHIEGLLASRAHQASQLSPESFAIRQFADVVQSVQTTIAQEVETCPTSVDRQFSRAALQFDGSTRLNQNAGWVTQSRLLDKVIVSAVQAFQAEVSANARTATTGIRALRILLHGVTRIFVRPH